MAYAIYRNVHGTEDAPDPQALPLYRMYAVLAFSKGLGTTSRDVHDAWSAWTLASFPAHRSLVPFAELTPEVQALDDQYRDGIHQAVRDDGLDLDEQDRVDRAYAERDRLVAALSRVFRGVRWTDPNGEPGFRTIVYLALPTGQASWRIRDEELPWFRHLPAVKDNPWDGHSTDEKYARLAELSLFSAAPV